MVQRHPFSFRETWTGLIAVQRESGGISICSPPVDSQMETLSSPSLAPSQILKIKNLKLLNKPTNKSGPWLSDTSWQDWNEKSGIKKKKKGISI